MGTETPQNILPVIIVTYGRSELTRKTLASLWDRTPRDRVKIIILDNGSGPKTLEVLDSFRPDVLIKLGENKGKPLALNTGIFIANMLIPGTDRYLLCDNDIEFETDWFPEMMETFTAHRDYKLAWLSGFVYRHLNRPETKAGKTVDRNPYAPGCAVMLSREAFEAVGPFDTEPDKHGYNGKIKMIDTRYIKRLKLKGYWNGTVSPKSVINHLGRGQRSWRMDTGEPILFE